MSDQPRRNPVLDLPVFESGFTMFPTFFVDELMPFAAGTPASFWKYLLILWRDIVGVGCDKKGYRTAKIMTSFHMDKDTASQWTAALSVSGLFTIAYGRRFAANLPGVPTVIQYRHGSTVEEWQCFITALRDELQDGKTKSFKTKGDGVWGFRISLSFRVDNERSRRGLPRIHIKWHEELEKSGDTHRRDGNMFTFSRTYTNTSRVRNAEQIRKEEEQDAEILGAEELDRIKQDNKDRQKENRDAAHPKISDLNTTHQGT